MELKNLFDMVRDFHDNFSLPRATNPTESDRELQMIRFKLMQEENDEYFVGEPRDIVTIADAIGDMLYVLIGTAITHGIEEERIALIFEEIHHSNMSKLENGKPLFNTQTGKVMKGKNYFKPNLNQFLQ